MSLRIPFFISNTLKHFLRLFPARYIVREREFKRMSRATKKSSPVVSTVLPKKKDHIRTIRRFTIPRAAN